MQTLTVGPANKVLTINFPVDNGTVAVSLLWDRGEKEPFAAENWCHQVEGSALEGPGRSGSYSQWLKQMEQQRQH